MKLEVATKMTVISRICAIFILDISMWLLIQKIRGQNLFDKITVIIENEEWLPKWPLFSPYDRLIYEQNDRSMTNMTHVTWVMLHDRYFGQDGKYFEQKRSIFDQKFTHIWQPWKMRRFKKWSKWIIARKWTSSSLTGRSIASNLSNGNLP